MRDFSSAHQLETDRLSSLYQLEEPSSHAYPRLTSRVALQAPPADSISTGSSSCFLGLSCERGKQAVLTCKTRSTSPRLGEELGVETPRRLSSCTANEKNLAAISLESRKPFGMKNQREPAHRFTSANLACRVNAECELHFG
jgi:hypothetical protein